MQNGVDSGRSTDVKPRIVNETPEKNKLWKLTEIKEASQCRCMRLPDSGPTAKVTFMKSPFPMCSSEKSKFRSLKRRRLLTYLSDE